MSIVRAYRGIVCGWVDTRCGRDPKGGSTSDTVGTARFELAGASDLTARCNDPSGSPVCVAPWAVTCSGAAAPGPRVRGASLGSCSCAGHWGCWGVYDPRSEERAR